METGAIASSEWARVFNSVPRHPFVPRVFKPSAANDGRYSPVDGTDPAQREGWLRHVYSDEICITQLDGDDRAWGTAVKEGTVQATAMTCTSSQPTLMAGMLEALDLQDGDRVLEIGTGTGYNAALLSERLGSRSVSSVDIDPTLTERAEAVLAGLGYTPVVAAEDGARGLPDNGPFTHLITTASFPSIPAAWLDQISEGGAILANLFRPLGGGVLVRLTVSGDRAIGHFSARTAGFMPTRSHTSPSALALYRRVGEEDEDAAEAETSRLDAAAILRAPETRFFLSLMSDFDEIRIRYPDHPEEQWLVTADGSWAFSVGADGGFTAKQGGPRRLWDEFEALYSRWRALGEPERHRFGLTVAGEEHRIWLDHPDQRVMGLL